MKNALIIIGIVVGILLIGGCTVIGIRNGLINKEETISQQWSEVENQLQRRYDLIPNLVATVKGYAKHESEVFKNIADARAAMFSATNCASVSIFLTSTIFKFTSLFIIFASSFLNVSA